MIYEIEELHPDLIEKASFTKIAFDVGMAIDAPTSATWLKQTGSAGDYLVIGIEPHRGNLQCLRESRTDTHPPVNFDYLKINENAIYNNGVKVHEYNPHNLIVVAAAIDDVEGVEEGVFYETDSRNIGCSSLLRPTVHLGLTVEKVSRVKKVSMAEIIERLGIGQIILDSPRAVIAKTDAQGKDFSVVRSFGKYLASIGRIQCEYNVGKQYESPDDQTEFFKFMKDRGYTIMAQDGYDVQFDRPL
jgi:hypothetical protein